MTETAAGSNTNWFLPRKRERVANLWRSRFGVSRILKGGLWVVGWRGWLLVRGLSLEGAVCVGRLRGREAGGRSRTS